MKCRLKVHVCPEHVVKVLQKTATGISGGLQASGGGLGADGSADFRHLLPGSFGYVLQPGGRKEFDLPEHYGKGAHVILVGPQSNADPGYPSGMIAGEYVRIGHTLHVPRDVLSMTQPSMAEIRDFSTEFHIHVPQASQ